ncbi:MAG TPA: SRPBCC domain-containing protein, partial [Saprospiraceae bacterium]|nr:SRPBCC domain-containing protein [Saprospiraceae bacterium]
GDEFRYQYQDMHVSRQKLIELVPDQKVTWLVSGSHLSFVKKTDEWDGTRITFELKDKGKKTEVHFIHEGLVPSFECFQACSDGWGYYVGESLNKLITTGKGKPDKAKS